MIYPEKFTLLKAKISCITLDTAWETMLGMIKERAKGYICVAPVSTVMDCEDDPQYCDIVNNAVMATPDGMPVVWYAHMLGYKEVSRTYGPDLMLKACCVGQTHQLRHFFYGGTPEVLGDLKNLLHERYSNCIIAGMHAPGILKIGELEKSEIIATINASQSDIIWVGLGSPKQDYWMAKHRDLLNAPVIIGVGAAFDFIAGHKPQAPQWMQRNGLEWLFRFSSEPKRLWKRYLIGNTRFIFLIVINLLKKLFNSHA